MTIRQVNNLIFYYRNDCAGKFDPKHKYLAIIWNMEVKLHRSLTSTTGGVEWSWLLCVSERSPNIHWIGDKVAHTVTLDVVTKIKIHKNDGNPTQGFQSMDSHFDH
jgi:hypothetical protein